MKVRYEERKEKRESIEERERKYSAITLLYVTSNTKKKQATGGRERHARKRLYINIYIYISRYICMYIYTASQPMILLGRRRGGVLVGLRRKTFFFFDYFSIMDFAYCKSGFLQS